MNEFDTFEESIENEFSGKKQTLIYHPFFSQDDNGIAEIKQNSKNDIKHVMESKNGRRLMYRILILSGYKSDISALNKRSEDVYFFEGRRTIGTDLVTCLKAVSYDLYLKMINENEEYFDKMENDNIVQ